MDTSNRWGNLEIDDNLLAKPETEAPQAPAQVPTVQVDTVKLAQLEEDLNKSREERLSKRGDTHLIAVEEDNVVAGLITYWRLSGGMSIEKLAATGRVDSKMLPSPISAEVALNRATRSLTSKECIVRKHPDGGWAVVYEQVVLNPDGSKGLHFTCGFRTYLDANDEVCFDVLDNLDEAKTAQVVAAVKMEFSRNLNQLSATDVSAWVSDVVYRLGGVSLRQLGGVYFVPSGSIETFKSIKMAVHEVSEHVLYTIPAIKKEESVRAVLDALVEEVQGIVTEIENEYNAGQVGSRGVKSRLDILSKTKKKVESYAKLLGVSFADLLSQIDTVTKKISKVASRGSLLEVD